MSKYDPIGRYLSCIELTQEKITLSFHKIEEILDCKLLNSAYQHSILVELRTDAKNTSTEAYLAWG